MKAHPQMKKRLLSGSLVFFALIEGCGSSAGESKVGASTANNASGTGSSVSLIGSGSTGSGSTGSGSSGSGTPSACVPEQDSSGCVGEQFAGETVPLDVYILFDQSCSMSCPISDSGPAQCCVGGPNERIVPVRAAIDAFLHAPESAGINFGLGFFGADPLGQASCSPSHYQTPAVPVGSGRADQMVAALAQAMPIGETPTGAALRGACSYTQQVKHAEPSHSVVILLVTDGVPETPVTRCGATLPDAVQAAVECATDAQQPIKTYVLGIGQALSNLNQIAAAGGTKQAHFVDGGDVTANILTALNAIRGDAVIPCQLQIPPAPNNSTLDFSSVNLGVCTAGGAPQTTYNVPNQAACGNGAGWYYDDPANPQSIVLCQASCDTVSVPGAQLYYSVGCATQTVVR
jgi:von Willebrand factor type A domain